MIGARSDAMLGEFTLLGQYLALAAFALSATNRFQIDTQSLRRLQHTGADRDLAAQTRGHEQDVDFFFHCAQGRRQI